MKVKVMLAGIMLLALVGCGGNSEPDAVVPDDTIEVTSAPVVVPEDTTPSRTEISPKPPNLITRPIVPPKPPAALLPKQVVCLFGDSTQASRVSYDYVIRDLVSFIYKDSEVHNFGISGSVTNQGIYGIPGWSEPMATIIRDYGCTVVTTNYGINDAAKLQTSPEAFIAQTKQAEAQAVAAGAIFLVENPNPILNSYDTYLMQYSALENANFAAVMHYDAIKALPNWQAMLPDGVHPNSELLLFKTNLLTQRIMEELHKKFN